MKLTIESTSEIIPVGGTPTRVWRGKSEDGVDVVAFVAVVTVRSHECGAFEAGLNKARHLYGDQEVADASARILLLPNSEQQS